VSLPFTTKTQSHLNESLASVQPVVDDGGLLFSVNASDTVSSNERKSVLSVRIKSIPNRSRRRIEGRLRASVMPMICAMSVCSNSRAIASCTASVASPRP